MIHLILPEYYYYLLDRDSRINWDWVLGGGGVQGQGKGQRLMGIKAVMTTLGWQHAKVKSTKSNPPSKDIKICPYNYPVWTAPQA